jgi:hypothetical protein
MQCSTAGRSLVNSCTREKRTTAYLILIRSGQLDMKKIRPLVYPLARLREGMETAAKSGNFECVVTGSEFYAHVESCSLPGRRHRFRLRDLHHHMLHQRLIALRTVVPDGTKDVQLRHIAHGTPGRNVVGESPIAKHLAS